MKELGECVGRRDPPGPPRVVGFIIPWVGGCSQMSEVQHAFVVGALFQHGEQVVQTLLLEKLVFSFCLFIILPFLFGGFWKILVILPDDAFCDIVLADVMEQGFGVRLFFGIGLTVEAALFAFFRGERVVKGVPVVEGPEALLVPDQLPEAAGGADVDGVVGLVDLTGQAPKLWQFRDLLIGGHGEIRFQTAAGAVAHAHGGLFRQLQPVFRWDLRDEQAVLPVIKPAAYFFIHHHVHGSPSFGSWFYGTESSVPKISHL